MPGVFNFVQCHGKLAATNRRLNVMSVLLLTGQVNVLFYRNVPLRGIYYGITLIR